MKLNWGLSIGIVYVLFVTAMILFAVKVSQQKNDLVTDNYYEEAVNYQKRIDAENNATESISKLKIEYLKEINALEITTSGNEEISNGKLSFYKPDNASSDFQLDFIVDATGKKQIHLKEIDRGYWKVFINWKSSGIDFFEETKIFIP